MNEQNFENNKFISFDSMTESEKRTKALKLAQNRFPQDPDTQALVVKFIMKEPMTEEEKGRLYQKDRMYQLVK